MKKTLLLNLYIIMKMIQMNNISKTIKKTIIFFIFLNSLSFANDQINDIETLSPEKAEQLKQFKIEKKKKDEIFLKKRNNEIDIILENRKERHLLKEEAKRLFQ